jgi:hypothetical protein
VFAFANHHVVGIARDLAIAGSCVRSADNRRTAGTPNLIPEERLVQRIQTITGDVGFRFLYRAQMVSCLLACSEEHGIGISCRRDRPPVYPHRSMAEKIYPPLVKRVSLKPDLRS